MKTLLQPRRLFAPIRIFILPLIVSCLILKTGFSQAPDLGEIINAREQSLRFVAIGSSLSSGMRDGKLSAAAQKTSFPTMIAQQMGINFREALLPDDISPSQYTKSTRQNLSAKNLLDFGEDITQLPKFNGEPDNLALPYLKMLDVYEPISYANSFVNKKSFKYLERLLSVNEEGKVSYLNYLQRLNDISFFTLEVGTDDYISYIKSGGFGTSIIYMGARESFGEVEILEILKSKKGKGVIANVPDILDFPAFSFYTLEKLQAANPNHEIFISFLAESNVRKANNQDIFLPSSTISKLVDKASNNNLGLSAENPIPDKDVLSIDEIETISVKGYNKAVIEKLAEKYNLPVVDLYTLYKQIFSGSYETFDGILVDATFPTGNFFSSDGITPTAFGQAVIANEFIKVINDSYKSKIPYLSTSKYVEK